MATAISPRRIRAAAVVAAASIAAVVAAASPAAALPAFGTAPVTVPGSGGAGPGHQVTISSVTVGRHDSEGFDRIVFAVASGLPTVSAQYVPQVTQDGSGRPVPLLGTAFIQVSMRSTTAGSPQQTITPAGFRALKQLKGAGDFEAVTSYGIGQATRAGFRIFTLTGPNRVVIDVAAPPGAARAAAGSAAPGSGSDTTAGGRLATTGVPVLPIALLGGAALIAGAATLVVRRRPRAA